MVCQIGNFGTGSMKYKPQLGTVNRGFETFRKSIQYVICIQFPLIFFFFFFFLVGERVTVRQDYFTLFEPNKSVGGAKMADPREKTPDHPQAELGLSHM